MTKLMTSEKCAFYSQVVNLWLPSRDHEFISWMERSIRVERYWTSEWHWCNRP